MLTDGSLLSFEIGAPQVYSESDLLIYKYDLPPMLFLGTHTVLHVQLLNVVGCFGELLALWSYNYEAL